MKFYLCILFLMVFIFEARSQSYHFVCHEKLSKGFSQHASALLVPYGKSLQDKKSGALFSLLKDAKSFVSYKEIDVRFKQSTKAPNAKIIMRSLQGETLIIDAEGMKRDLLLKQKSGVKKYQCFAEGSV